jgi:hypothetical protein
MPCESYSNTKTSKARFHDVTKTPEELGLKEWDIIHVKDLSTGCENRPKLVGDLLAEAPTKLKAQDLVELTIFAKDAVKWKFNSCLKDSSRTVSQEVSRFQLLKLMN